MLPGGQNAPCRFTKSFGSIGTYRRMLLGGQNAPCRLYVYAERIEIGMRAQPLDGRVAGSPGNLLDLWRPVLLYPSLPRFGSVRYGSADLG